MEQIFEFIGNHTSLFLAFTFVLGLLMWSFLSEQLSGIKGVLPQEATLLINHEEAFVLDVREDGEYAKGHILNSMHIPLSMLPDKISRLEKYQQHPIIISCQSGNRSGAAARKLMKNGFEKVHNLKGGILAWQNANLPLSKGKSRSK